MSISFDVASTKVSANGVTSDSFTHTPTGIPTIAVLLAHLRENPGAVGTPTYGGANMVPIDSTDGSKEIHAWYKLAPAAGAKTVAYSWTDAARGWAVCQTFLGRTHGADNADKNVGTASNDTATVANTRTSDMVSEIVMHVTNEAHTPGSGQTEDFDLGSGIPTTAAMAVAHKAADLGSTTLQYSWATSSDFSHIAFRIASAAANNQVLIFASKIQDFMKELKAGRLPATEIQKMYGDLLTI